MVKFKMREFFRFFLFWRYATRKLSKKNGALYKSGNTLNNFIKITTQNINMSDGSINLVKLCVGANSVSDLVSYQKSRLSEAKKLVHVTRMRPKKEKELLDGGSIYWVFRGLILARQQILGFEEVIGSDKIKRCGLLLSEDVYRTSPQPKRAFQGWRYLKIEDSPPDLGKYKQAQEELPHSLQMELSRLGVY